MEKPEFDRIDLAIMLSDGTMSDTVVFYHDNLLDSVVDEVSNDADKVNGTFVILSQYK